MCKGLILEYLPLEVIADLKSWRNFESRICVIHKLRYCLHDNVEGLVCAHASLVTIKLVFQEFHPEIII